MPNFDRCDENPLLTKKFSELGVDSMKDIDIADIILFARDMMQEAGEDLAGPTSHHADDICNGHSCQLAAMYLNLALRAVFDSISFELTPEENK